MGLQQAYLLYRPLHQTLTMQFTRLCCILQAEEGVRRISELQKKAAQSKQELQARSNAALQAASSHAAIQVCCCCLTVAAV